MAVSTDADGTDEVDSAGRETPTVDPRAPRFGQAVTAVGLGTAVVVDFPPLVYAVTAVLVLAVVSGWRLDVYAAAWQYVVVPLVGPPAETEAAAPHRFARVLGALGGTFASGLLLAGLSLPGYAVTGAVAALAGLAATTGLCLGCRLYRQVQLFQRVGVV